MWIFNWFQFQADCLLPKYVQGARGCMAFFPMYHYDYEIDECVKFIYGGCNGTKNVFYHLQECEKACKDESVKPIKNWVIVLSYNFDASIKKITSKKANLE